jgi:hypothetical protein
MENNRDVKLCLEKLTDHMINSDKRHEKTDIRVTSLAKTQEGMIKDISKMLKIMGERQGFWKALDNLSKFGKFVVITILLGILTAAGAGIYNYVTKAETPAIKPIKEGAK